MAATVHINRHTGAASGSPAVGTPLAIDGGNTRMAQSDNPNDGTANPVPIPTTGTNYSWWVSTILAVGTPGATNGINNVLWYSDGTSAGTGLTIVGNTAAKATGYTQATATLSNGVATNGTILNTTTYPALSANPQDVTSNGFVAGTPKSVPGSVTTATNTNISDFFVFQLLVTSTANPGTMSQRTFTWSYQET